MFAFMPFIRRAVGDMAMADHLGVFQPVFPFQYGDKVTDGRNLSKRHRLIVMTYDLYADRVLVAILKPAPHRSSGVKSFPVSIHNAVYDAFFVYTVMSLAALGKLIKGTSRTGFGSVKNYKSGRLSDGTLRISRTAVPVGKRKRPCAQGHPYGNPHRQRFQYA
jgi:hypothetical protein